MNNFLRYTGDKTSYRCDITSYFPANVDIYVEPFAGSASIAFYSKFQHVILSDHNPNLMACFVAIRDNVELLISLLKEEQEYFDDFCRTNNDVERKSHYEQLRDEYNMNKMHSCADFKETDLRTMTGIAALFILFNQTGTNGIYREDRNGNCTVLVGDHNVQIIDEKLLREMSHYLNTANVDIRCEDVFDLLSTLPKCKNGLIYCDPPYIPIPIGSYTCYSPDGFDEPEHTRLADVLWSLQDKGYHSVISNSASTTTFNVYFGYEFVDIKESPNEILLITP